jgi:hypothetical protein
MVLDKNETEVTRRAEFSAGKLSVGGWSANSTTLRHYIKIEVLDKRLKDNIYRKFITAGLLYPNGEIRKIIRRIYGNWKKDRYC